MTDRVADLHLHTHYSDGTWEPEALVRRAVSLGFAAIAITDHDTLESAPEAIAAADAAGIELLPGLELSTEKDGQDIHLLGFLFDRDYGALRTWLEALQAQRLQRLHVMVERLRALGVDISVQDVLTLSGRGTVGRLHVARTLLQSGAISRISQAFDKYIGTNKPAFVAEHHPTPETAIQQIRAAGGVPVLAHPAFLNDDAIIPQLIEAGLLGLEVYHSGHDAGQQARYRQMAEQRGLVMTGGSDCHGTAKGAPLVGQVRLPYTYVEALKQCQAQIAAS